MFDDWGDVLQPLRTGAVVGSFGLWRGDRPDRRRSRRQMAPEGLIELAVAADQADWLRSRLAGAHLPAAD